VLEKTNADSLNIICCTQKVYDDSIQWEFNDVKWYACKDIRNNFYQISGNIEIDIRMYIDDDPKYCYCQLKKINQQEAENILYNDIIPNISPNKQTIKNIFQTQI
jgi:hypothetical protein